MTNPDQLVDAVVEFLRLVPTLMTVLGGPDKITAYDESLYDGTLLDVVSAMPDSTVLVAWMGNTPAADDAPQQWVHDLSVFIRARIRLGGVFRELVDGVSTTLSEQPFHLADIHPNFELLGVPAFSRDADDEGMEYPRVNMRFREK